MTDYLFKTAVISGCKKYRYVLERIWDTSLKATVFIMLNPSIADGKEDDPTIWACVQFAKNLGSGGLTVVNLVAYRATDPEGLNYVDDPVGPENFRYIKDVCKSSDAELVICAWGSKLPKARKNAGQEMIKILKHWGIIPFALKLNEDFNPRHPLYIKRNTEPFIIEGINNGR